MMSEPSLAEIKAFHQDLLTVSAAGVRLAGGALVEQVTHSEPGWFARRREEAQFNSLRESLLTVEQRLAAASLEGRSIAEVLESQSLGSPLYIAALQAWLTNEHDPAAFNAWAGAADRVQRRKWNKRIAWVQPLVWLVVSYLGLSFICLAVAPQFLSLSRQLGVEPGYALSTVLSIRAGFPVWGAVVPILILALAIWLYLGDPSGPWLTRFNRGPVAEAESGDSAPTTATALAMRHHGRPLQTGPAWVLFGGVLVLGISLSVFGPLIELFYSVALPFGICLPLGIFAASRS